MGHNQKAYDKLDGIESGATADQTAEEIIAILEGLSSGQRLSHLRLDDSDANTHHSQLHSIESHTGTTGTGAELTELTDGSDITIHKHDGRYFTETEINTKFVDGTIKHDALGNPLTDTHSQYLRTDGARKLTGPQNLNDQELSNVNIVSGKINDITDLSISDGGTGASSGADARTNLGLVIGTDVAPESHTLTTNADHDGRYIVRSVDADHLLVTAGKLDFSVNQDTSFHRWQGSFLEQFDFTISVSNGTVTGSLEKEGGGDLTEFFSDEFTTLNTPATVDLTSLVGTDTDPEAAFVYILQSDKPTLVAAAVWPAASVEHIRVASVVLQSAATTGTEKALMNRNWNDMSFGVTNPRGHGLHLGERLRFEHALWNSGVVLLITGSGTGTVTLDTSAGTVYQLHLHVFPAIDMAGADNIHLVNLSGSEYSTSVNLVADITTLANGSTSLANNKYFNIVVWGVQNRSGETSHLMCNLPTGQYTKSADATVDSRKFSVHTIPPAFRGTGFLIAELTFQFVSGPTWTLVQNKDLLGQTPTLVPGGGTTTNITTFPDSSFEVFDNGDDSKRLAFELSGLTTGITRTLIIPDTDSTIITSDGKTPFTGDVTLTSPAEIRGSKHIIMYASEGPHVLTKDSGVFLKLGEVQSFIDGKEFVGEGFVPPRAGSVTGFAITYEITSASGEDKVEVRVFVQQNGNVFSKIDMEGNSTGRLNDSKTQARGTDTFNPENVQSNPGIAVQFFNGSTGSSLTVQKIIVSLEIYLDD